MNILFVVTVPSVPDAPHLYVRRGGGSPPPTARGRAGGRRLPLEAPGFAHGCALNPMLLNVCWVAIPPFAGVRKKSPPSSKCKYLSPGRCHWTTLVRDNFPVGGGRLCPQRFGRMLATSTPRRPMMAPDDCRTIDPHGFRFGRSPPPGRAWDRTQDRKGRRVLHWNPSGIGSIASTPEPGREKSGRRREGLDQARGGGKEKVDGGLRRGGREAGQSYT